MHLYSVIRFGEEHIKADTGIYWSVSSVTAALVNRSGRAVNLATWNPKNNPKIIAARLKMVRKTGYQDYLESILYQ